MSKLSSLLAAYQQQKRKDPEEPSPRPEQKRTALEPPRDPPPDFLILGAQKAGTMAAVKNLNKHPELFVLKEPHFFDLAWHNKSIAAYCRQFSNSGKRVRGEKTPELIYVDDCAPRIKQVCPDAKFILYLRDPVRRAYSAWNMNVNRNTEELPFDACCKRNFDNPHEFRSHGTAEYHYVQRGFYLEQILRFLRIFPDRSKLLIVIAEHVRVNPQREYRRIFEFLGVRADIELEIEEEHVGSYGKPMSSAMRDRLIREFRPHNERLFAFLGFRIPEWDGMTPVDPPSELEKTDGDSTAQCQRLFTEESSTGKPSSVSTHEKDIQPS